MQRERERATHSRLKHVPKLPCLVVLVFYCVLYAYTVHQSLRRQDGHLLNTKCDAPLTVAGDYKLYELDKSPLGLPLPLANFSKLAVDYILVDDQTRYTYNTSEPFLRVLSSDSGGSEVQRQAPLGEYQFYSDPDLWERLDATSRPTRFPQKCFGKRLRTSEWSLEVAPVWDDRLLEMLGKLGQVLLIFLLAVIPRGLCRWSNRESITWNIILGFVICFLGHGLMGGCLLMSWAGANFMLARTCARRPFALAAAWCLNFPVMLLGFRYLGPLDYWDNFCGGGPEQELRYTGRCSDLHKTLHWTVEELPFMVGFSGLCPWHSIRFVTLRMIAFFVDYVHAIRETPPGLRLENKPELIVRQEINQPLHRYTFGHFVAYLFYPPLYWGGPIVNFNAFVSQVYEPQKTYSAKEVTTYCFRLALTALITVICLHFNYASVLLYRKTPPPVRHDIGAWEMWGLVHWMLQYQWLSLILLWRLSRAVALLDGIDVPENMLLCVDANYRFEHFWRIWHASLNRWALRYVYFPLGGRKRPWLAIPCIFGFVAFWHETTGPGTEPLWYAWGALNALGVFTEKALSGLKFEWPAEWMRCAVLGLNMFFLIGANVPVLFFERTLTIAKEVFAGGPGSLLLLPALWVVYACTISVVDALRMHGPDVQDLPREIPMRALSDAGGAKEDASGELRERAPSEYSSASGAGTGRRRGSVDDSSFTG